MSSLLAEKAALMRRLDRVEEELAVDAKGAAPKQRKR